MFKAFQGSVALTHHVIINSDWGINVTMLQGQPLWKVFYWGHRSARENYALQLRNITEEAYKSLGERPVLIGETGIPLDMKCVPRIWNPLDLC